MFSKVYILNFEIDVASRHLLFVSTKNNSIYNSIYYYITKFSYEYQNELKTYMATVSLNNVSLLIDLNFRNTKKILESIYNNNRLKKNRIPLFFVVNII